MYNKMIWRIAAVCVGVSITGFGQGQWTESQLPIPSNVIMYDIDFESENRGWAVGSQGHILFFDGNSWEVDSVIAGNNFTMVVFPKENEGWAITGSGRIFRHDGNQWNLDFTTTGGKGLFTLNFINPDEGFVSGADGYLAYYNGTVWTEGNIGFNEFTLTSHFSDNKNGWLSSGAGQLYQFRDSIWSSVTISSGGAFNAMTFTAADNGYGTGFSKDIWRYDGTDWAVDYAGENDQFTSLFFLNETRGWAGGNGYIATYNNGSWREEVVSSSWIFDVHFTDPNHGWAMGEDGILLTYTNPYASLIWRPLDFPPPELFIVDFSTNQSGIIYGAGYTQGTGDPGSGLFKSTDGVNWTRINSAFDDFIVVYCIHVVDNILLASLFDKNGSVAMLKSIDDGLSWNPAQNGLPANVIVEDITSANNGDLYAVANLSNNNKFSPQLYKSIDNAESWNLVNITGLPTSSNAAFANINYTGSEFVISYLNLETSDGGIYTSVDGMDWSKLNSVPPDFNALDIAIGNNDTWYASGLDDTNSEGRLYVSINKGASWEPMGATGLGEYNHQLVAIHSVGDQLLLGTSRPELTDRFKVFTTIPKQAQTVTFSPLATVIYDMEPLTLTASASSGLPVTYSSANTSVAGIVDDVITIAGAGSTIISASQEGNNNFIAAEKVDQLLSVQKALLNVSVEDVVWEAGEPNPSFVLIYDGFVNGENIEVINVLPEASAAANTTSAPGQYEITIAGGSDDNYEFSYEFGTLTVVAPTVTGLKHPSENGIKIYPNPTTGIINIETTQWSGKGIMEVFNAAGEKIMTRKLDQRMTLNLASYLSGVYLVTISQGQKVYVSSVLKL